MLTKERVKELFSYKDGELFWLISNGRRIKPEEKKPVIRWLWVDEHGFTSPRLSDESYGEYKIKLEWSRTEFPE